MHVKATTAKTRPGPLMQWAERSGAIAGKEAGSDGIDAVIGVAPCAGRAGWRAYIRCWQWFRTSTLFLHRIGRDFNRVRSHFVFFSPPLSHHLGGAALLRPNKRTPIPEKSIVSKETEKRLCIDWPFPAFVRDDASAAGVETFKRRRGPRPATVSLA